MTHTVLITGCSSGFEKLTAKTFSQKGWNVIATMRSPGKEIELTELSNVLVTKLDVTDPASIAAAIQQGVAQFGRRVNDPQDVAEKIYECATQNTPIHNPVGSDAVMLTGMIAAAESRQAFIEQVTPLLMP